MIIIYFCKNIESIEDLLLKLKSHRVYTELLWKEIQAVNKSLFFFQEYFVVIKI